MAKNDFKTYLPKPVKFIRQMIVKIIPENTKLFRFLCLVGFKITARGKHARRTSMKIDIPAVEHCNLSCKGCTTFGPIAHESFLDPGSYEKDMKKLSELTNLGLTLLPLPGVSLFYIRG
jgi:hypothetical protein